ncbi:MAG: site-specific DNA-methyltransferase [Zoogloeaceae bacterium]|jgi:adenine-specific DNA-methyltransferase|nr:site-specific DNA-methyltransferase [Zoogloeaceae bacterium]
MPILSWLGKEKVVNHHQQVPYRVLEAQYVHGQAECGNMLIHGDNLDALKSLLPRYEDKVKCVYIDPPYNTGNEGWVYNDNVNDPKIRKWLGEVVGKEGEDLSRHDKWLCMMYPRLKLLQRLLAEDGAIFISIDSVELSSLMQICSDIFGFGNFVDMISWFKKSSPSNDAHYFSNDIEYVVVYAKNKKVWQPKRITINERQMKYYTNPDNDPRGRWNSATYTCNKSKTERPNLYYPVTNPNTGEEVWPKETAVWAYARDVYEEHASENLLYWGANGKAKFPRFKKFLSDHQGVVNRTLWHYEDVGHTQGATNEIKKIFGEAKVFDTPKPSTLIERILQISTDHDSIILDSFAGSGTTAHAVLNMNKNDGGNRKFILIEMENYVDTITAERIKRVINGYGNTEGTGGGFAYCKLGDRLLFENGNLNETLAVEKIREYVWYTETRSDYTPQEEAYLLGLRANTAYYFYYEKQRVTVLDHDFLNAVKTKAGSYLIYADINTLSAKEMDAANIRFKKIPRDITKL